LIRLISKKHLLFIPIRSYNALLSSAILFPPSTTICGMNEADAVHDDAGGGTPSAQ
jgi:hypothetical protein